MILPLVLMVAALQSSTKDCNAPPTGITPVCDMAPGGRYQGFAGGLYGDGSNACPAAHLQAGLAAAAGVMPRDVAGNPDDGGLIGVAALGMSNSKICWSAFMAAAAADPSLDPRLRFVNGAQGGKDILDWSDPTSPAGATAWSTFATELANAGVAAPQLQVVFVLNLGQRWWNQQDTAFPASAVENQALLVKVAQQVRTRYPAVKLLYGSSLTYGGYCLFDDGSAGAPYKLEPWAFESAFTYKWAFEQQMNGDPALEPGQAAPWMAWGPYLWADGIRPRSDGLTWQCSDFLPDGHHEGPAGSAKVASLVLGFLKNDPTAKTWVLPPAAPPPASGGGNASTIDGASSGSGACSAHGAPVVVACAVLALGLLGLRTS